MTKPHILHWFIVISILVVGLIGCDLQRPAAQNNGDIAEFAPPIAPANQDTVVHLQPPAQQVGVNSITTIEIHINNVNNLFAVDIQLGFDPNFLQVRDADPNEAGIQIQPGNFLSPDFVVTNNADNTSGDIFFILTQRAPTPAVNGNGILATITFQAVAQGATQISFRDLLLSDINGQPISASVQGSQINIVSAGGVVPATATLPGSPTPGVVTPTFTPIPTQPITSGAPTQVPRLAQDTPTATIVAPPTATFTPTPITPTPIPPVTSIPPGATVGFCYRVQLGENIHDVAQKFAVSAENINIANDLYPPYLILAHQGLFIPEQMGYGPNIYVVRPGDTIDSIAASCKLTPWIILKANGLEKGAVVQAGHALIIPIPPFPPPARFGYPIGIIPLAKPPCCQPSPYR